MSGQVPYIHINVPRPYKTAIKSLACPTCNWQVLMFARFEEWYGATFTCLTCGDSWLDGERLPRPFAPRWRQDSVRSAKRAAERYGLRTDRENEWTATNRNTA